MMSDLRIDFSNNYFIDLEPKVTSSPLLDIPLQVIPGLPTQWRRKQTEIGGGGARVFMTPTKIIDNHFIL